MKLSTLVIVAAFSTFALTGCAVKTDKWLDSYAKVADAYIASIEGGSPDEKLAKEFETLNEEGAGLVVSMQERDPENADKFQTRYEEITLKVLTTSYGNIYRQRNQ